jgi:hypothetical protein
LVGCETWFLTLREEDILREFENRVLRGVFGHKRQEITADWRKLHKKEFLNLYSSPNIAYLHVSGIIAYSLFQIGMNF